MSNKKQKIDELTRELYDSKYRERVNISCCMNDETFKMYVLRDWRFWSIYNSYKAKTGNKISLNKFYEQELNNLYKFVVDCLLDIPKDVRPQNLYVDEVYPFKFETYKTDAPKYDDFVETINLRNLRKLGKAFNYLTADEIYTRLINDLEYKIKIVDEQNRREQDNKKNKKIFKYDKQGELIEIFENRNDCIERDGLKKAALSLHLNGQRKTLKGFVYKEIDYNKDNQQKL